MTLKEKLDEKVRQERILALWEEIQNLFLLLDYTELTKDCTFRIFSVSLTSPLCYVRVDDGRSVAKKFSRDYDIDTLDAVMPICEANGMNVEIEDKTSLLITYKP